MFCSQRHVTTSHQVTARANPFILVNITRELVTFVVSPDELDVVMRGATPNAMKAFFQNIRLGRRHSNGLQPSSTEWQLQARTSQNGSTLSGTHQSSILNSMLASIRPSVCADRNIFSSRSSFAGTTKGTASYEPQLSKTLKDIESRTATTRRILLQDESSSVLYWSATARPTLDKPFTGRVDSDITQNIEDTASQARFPEKPVLLRIPNNRHLSSRSLVNVSLNSTGFDHINCCITNHGFEKGDYLTDSQLDLFLSQERDKTATQH
eukprot:scaffold2308_cov103-Cylindrotheca_fusiformis.AAC.9